MTPIRKATFVGLISLALLLVFSAVAVAGPISAKKARLAAVQAQLDKVYEKSDVAVEQYNEATSRLKEVDARIARNRHLLTLAEARLQIANEHLTSRARQVYKANDTSLLDVVFASHTFDDLLTQLDVMQRMTQNDADMVHQAAVYRQDIRDKRVALEADRKSAVKLVAARQKSRQQILALQTQLEGTAGGLKTQIADLEAKAAAAAKAKAEAAARAAAAVAAAANAGSTTSSSTSSSSSSSSSSSTGGSTGGGTVVDPGGSGHSSVVAIAQRYLGVPYVWAGAGPTGFDCSGLAMFCYAQIGIYLSHSATDQQHASHPVPLNALLPGDLVFFGNASYSHHVGIYVGGGQMIDAPHTGAVVRYDSIAGAWIGGRF